ncbi:hypothetical protein QO200_03660 [Flavobacterium sp. Arc3]|uniref:hypothetical protein n=1 Tax=Flavobacterium sp. Arc3 TaxID=3046686 RepID=UPI00352C3FB6
MKKQKIANDKKLSLEKYKVAELKNPKMIIGGNAADDGGVITADPIRTVRS